MNNILLGIVAIIVFMILYKSKEHKSEHYCNNCKKPHVRYFYNPSFHDLFYYPWNPWGFLPCVQDVFGNINCHNLD